MVNMVTTDMSLLMDQRKILLIDNICCLSSSKVKVSKCQLLSHVQLFACSPPVLCPWNSPGKSTGTGDRSLLQGIFPTQGWNPGLPHCRQILLPAEPQGKPKNTSGQPIPPPGDLPDPEIELGSPALQADSLPTELSGKPQYQKKPT